MDKKYIYSVSCKFMIQNFKLYIFRSMKRKNDDEAFEAWKRRVVEVLTN